MDSAHHFIDSAETSSPTSPLLLSSANNEWRHRADGHGGSSSKSSDAMAAASAEVLSRRVEFMTFFFQHLASCPPHGPFRYYSALTCVERARHRFFGTSKQTNNNNSNNSNRNDASARVGGDAELEKALFVDSVLHLIDAQYNTTHLAGWPLMYVPAEIRLSDVETLVAQAKSKS